MKAGCLIVLVAALSSGLAIGQTGATEIHGALPPPDLDALELAFQQQQPILLPSEQAPADQAPADKDAQGKELPSQPRPDLPDAPIPIGPRPVGQMQSNGCGFPPCPAPKINWYMRFVNGPQVRRLTPAQKGWLALRNWLDPFNGITILGTAAISVGSDAHSPYGPGMPGFGRYVGVSYTQDLTGEFFNTFLIPSIAHQDPHYHRMPSASYRRRALHCLAQVVWTQGDNGRGMLNYANLVGFAIDDEISNLYVPGRDTNAGATTQRYFVGLISAPISNVITEFLPDVASHIHVQAVIVQRIVNQVARTEPAGQ